MGAFNYLKEIINTNFKPTWITLDSFGEKCGFILLVFLSLPFIFIFEHDTEEGKWYALYNIIAIWLLVILLAIF